MIAEVLTAVLVVASPMEGPTMTPTMKPTDAFELAFDYTQIHEGGNRPDGGLNVTPGDPGGTTKYGISQKAHPNIDIRSLRRDEAKRIAKEQYWDPLNLGRLRSANIAAEIFDTAFNAGTGTAAKMAQQAVNYLNAAHSVWNADRPQIDVDGQIGPVTLEHLNYWSRKDGMALMALLNALQAKHYIGLVEKNPRLIYAMRSWARRCLPPNLT